MSCASSGHITKLKQSIFAPFDIYGLDADILPFGIRDFLGYFLKNWATYFKISGHPGYFVYF